MVMSPTIHRERGYIVRLYIDDHEPPHVHVRCEGREAKIALGDEAVAPYVLNPGRMGNHELREAARVVIRYQAQFIEEWRKYNG